MTKNKQLAGQSKNKYLSIHLFFIFGYFDIKMYDILTFYLKTNMFNILTY
jgi:hypothetical protein